MVRGEIRLYRFRHPDKERPVLILTRYDVLDALNEIIVVPATRICERKGWADEARAYNGLVIAWPELEKLAAGGGPKVPAQGLLL